MSELAARLKITLGGVTSLANRMYKADLVDRKRSEKDRRVVRLVITEKGKSLLRDLAKARTKVLSHYYMNLTAKEILELDRICRKMLD